MEMGTERENVTPNTCVFSEPWTADPSVFKNIDDPQSNMVDIRHNSNIETPNGAVHGILFKTTSGDSLGLDTYCDSYSPATTFNDFDLGLGTLSIQGFYYGNYFDWARILSVDGTELVVNSYRDDNHIDLLYDPDRIKLLGTQSQTTVYASYGIVSHVRVFFRQYPSSAISFSSAS